MVAVVVLTEAAAVVGSVGATTEMAADLEGAADSRANRQEHLEGSSGTATVVASAADQRGAEREMARMVEQRTSRGT